MTATTKEWLDESMVFPPYPLASKITDQGVILFNKVKKYTPISI